MVYSWRIQSDRYKVPPDFPEPIYSIGIISFQVVDTVYDPLPLLATS